MTPPRPGRPSRRQFLGWLGAGGAASLLAACSRVTSSTAPPTSGTAGTGPGGAVTTTAPRGSFAQPEVLTSRDGRLEVTLRAEPRAVPYGTGTRYAYTYNGSTPGPTLRVRPGDRLVVTLENRLDAATNLHTHGLHVSPSGGADNIFVEVPPGGSRTYTYDLPADHRSGLFWYHPHVHHLVAEQVAAGMAGAIVVVDDLDDLPGLAASTERLWVLADPVIGTGPGVLAVSGIAQMQGREGDEVLVNGVRQPEVAVTAGRLERWRLVNASPSRYYRLALDGHDLHVVASDGGRLAAVATVSELLLAPGERAEVLVTPSQAGAYALRALAYDRGAPAMGGAMGGRAPGPSTTGTLVVATMAVAGSADPAGLPDRLADPAALRLPPAGSTRTVTFAMGPGGGGSMGGGSMMAFTIDGRTFEPDRTDITALPGSVEEWTIRNASPMDHPFHLHTWPFLVVGGAAHQGWKDTVNVPANRDVRIRIPFVGFTGRTVYHCHILDHEDLGMMGVIDVGS